MSAKTRITPRLPKGMRDFLPATVLKREYVFGIVREVFHLHGFEPLHTPVLELRETLLGKYGEDAEKLIYHAKHTEGKEELSLRYDLTVPLARVVAQHEHHLSFPFKRYQLAPVWRAERPQRGRYREFYQCDVDIVGVASASADAELISVVTTVLTRLKLPKFVVHINNRKLLTAMGQYSGVPDAQLGDLYRSVDKFDKVGAEGVKEELLRREIPAEAVSRMLELLQAPGTRHERLDFAEKLMGHLPAAQEGLRELREMAVAMGDLGIAEELYEFDFTMVRGLGYYTGPIFETVITEANIGSVSGGGRYDDLIGIFRKESLPTTGISLGIERITDVLDELDLYPPEISGTVVQALVTVFDEDSRAHAATIAATLRRGGVYTELYMQDKNLGRQIGYADKKGIPLVIVAGPEEIAAGVAKIKRLRDGVEVSAPLAALADQVRELLA